MDANHFTHSQRRISHAKEGRQGHHHGQTESNARYIHSRSENASSVKRSRIVVPAFQGHNNKTIEGIVGVQHDGVGRWRWRDNWERLIDIECSESLVRYLAESCGITEPLGKKGVRGILKSVCTRTEYFADPTDRLRILVTPRHCSWMNQIEIWFKTLRRKVMRRMNFYSLESLDDAIL